MNLLTALAPELVLIAVACVLFFLGTSHKASMRRLSALIALVSLVAVFVWQGYAFLYADGSTLVDEFNVVHVGPFSLLVKTIVAGVGAVLVLFAWPGNADATGSGSMNVGSDVGEFFGLALLAVAGVFMVSSANDLILLFLAIELAAIPTYIMVSISRPLPVAQEAGVKYFFLGAMAAAVMLFGFSYVYGGTGQIKLDAISATIDALRNGNGWAVPPVNSFLLMGLIVLLSGFAFKIAAVPFHAYVGDVYQGAATPVTALLAFVPKISGFLAILKILSAVGGPHYALPAVIGTLLSVVAVLTMTFGNVLGLLQLSVKRVLAYSSIAHSGYILVAVTALVMAGSQLEGDRAAAARVQQSAIQGILFYLAAYGLMNGGAFGILMLLPTRAHRQMGEEGIAPAATTAETFEDLAGQGRKHPLLGLGMAICCFSLIGLPLTVGFFGKVYLIMPALEAKLIWLVALTMINAAISAAYYLKIVSAMFIRPLPADETETPVAAEPRSLPLSVGVGVSVAATLVLGVALPWVDELTSRIGAAAASAGVTPAAPAGVVTEAPAIASLAPAAPVSSAAE